LRDGMGCEVQMRSKVGTLQATATTQTARKGTGPKGWGGVETVNTFLWRRCTCSAAPIWIAPP